MDEISFDAANWHKDIDNSIASVVLDTGTKVITNLGSINDFFAICNLPLTILKYPLPLSVKLQALICADAFLTDAEYAEVIHALLPTKAEALAILQQVNLTPAVVDDWSMQSTNTLNNCSYPRLNQSTTLQQEKIVNNLDRFHRNMTLVGVPCDELIYMLNGSVHFYFFTSRGVAQLDVTAANGVGWLLVYKGNIPHGGVFSPIAKQLALIAGPSEWQMQFYSLAALQAE